MTAINCKGCTQCCRGPNRVLELVISPESMKRHYWIFRDDVSKREYLAQKPNGDCVYLTDEGCSIYDMRPLECRGFDCRRVAWPIQNFPNMALAASIHR